MSSNHGKAVVQPADDLDSLLDRTGCRAAYQKVEECLATNNRNMSKCQVELLAFKTCYDGVQQEKRDLQTPARK